MVTFYNFLAGLGGGIIAIIVSAIGIPFIRKIIFKLFESKIDERANKAISDHNAKNDTKMHITKMLYDKEQIALQNILENFLLDFDCKHERRQIAVSAYEKTRSTDYGQNILRIPCRPAICSRA